MHKYSVCVVSMRKNDGFDTPPFMSMAPGDDGGEFTHYTLRFFVGRVLHSGDIQVYEEHPTKRAAYETVKLWNRLERITEHMVGLHG